MSKRTDQVSALLQQAINDIIMRDFEAPRDTLISVSQVTIAPDLKNATVYISVIPDSHWGSGLNAINKFSGHVQRELKNKVIMRALPRLHWQLDERDYKYKKIDDALRQP